MEVKGTSVKSIPEFVKAKYVARYDEWINALPEPSKKIMNGFIITSNWYQLIDALTVPMKTIAKVFYNGDERLCAWTMGRFSAEIALKGIYMIYVQLGSAKHIIDRASRVMSAYFQPSEIKVVSFTKNSLCVHITRFEDSSEIVEFNIAGWMEKALEISGCKNIQIEIPKSIAKGFPVTEFNISWS